MAALFVAGTESGVGKSVVAGALARMAVAAGALPVFYKPFSTDDHEDLITVIDAVADEVEEIPGRITMAPVHCECEYRFSAPISPYAGMREQREDVDVGSVLDTLSELRRGVRHVIEEHSVSMGARDTLPEMRRGEVVIVEGYGGAMTPIRRDYFMADLIRDMGIPAVAVTTNRIGALGLSAMTAMSCSGRGAPLAGFVVNCIDPGGYEPGRLCRDIKEVTGAPVLAVLEAHGPPAPRKKKGSAFGSFPPRKKMRKEDLPEGRKRTRAAARAVHRGGALDGIARMMLEGAGPGGQPGHGEGGKA